MAFLHNALISTKYNKILKSNHARNCICVFKYLPSFAFFRFFFRIAINISKYVDYLDQPEEREKLLVELGAIHSKKGVNPEFFEVSLFAVQNCYKLKVPGHDIQQRVCVVKPYLVSFANCDWTLEQFRLLSWLQK